MVVVAQLVRAPDCGSGGRGFESRLPPQKLFFKGWASRQSRQIVDLEHAGCLPSSTHKAEQVRFMAVMKCPKVDYSL